MKILIVSAYFPPLNSIASLRSYSWAKWFSRMGHDVTVLTTEKRNSPNDLRLDCSSFRIIKYPLWIPLSGLYHEAKRKMQEKSPAGLPLKFRLLNAMKKLYTSFATTTGCFYTCRYPDWHDWWARRAYKLVKNESWDLVISSGWPYSVHRIGLALKKSGKTKKWVVDWRDLWTKNHLFGGLRIFHPLERYLERKFHENADLITTVSEPLAEVLRRMTKTRIEVIYNGFDPEDFCFLQSKPRKQNERFEIVYTGTIYRRFRDPSPLFEAVGNLLRNGVIKPTDLRITFAGPAQTDVTDLADKYGVKEVYTYAGFIPREEALELQYNADVCLFLEYNNPSVKGILTGKLFEYLYTAREIWAIGVGSDSVAGTLIEKSNSGVALGTDVERIENLLIRRVKWKEQPSLQKDFAFIEQFSREKQALKLLELIGG
jgi:glycosyltransferase involved in cell wall biosynthesis